MAGFLLLEQTGQHSSQSRLTHDPRQHRLAGDAALQPQAVKGQRVEGGAAGRLWTLRSTFDALELDGATAL